jgi:hypothetical protein
VGVLLVRVPEREGVPLAMEGEGAGAGAGGAGRVGGRLLSVRCVVGVGAAASDLEGGGQFAGPR